MNTKQAAQKLLIVSDIKNNIRFQTLFSFF